MNDMADGLGFQPRVKEPETSGGANAGAGRAADAPFPFLAPNIPDTSAPGPTPLQEPAAWTYDFNPASGSSRAFFNGEVSANSISGGSAAGVTSWNGETGVVVMTLADITGTGGAPIASPVFTGNPAAPTRLAGDSSGGLATTAFVQKAIAAQPLVSSFNARTGAVVLTTADVMGAGGAPLVSPAFTGAPTAPTAPQGDTSNRVATDAFVSNAIASGAVASFNGRQGIVTLSLSDVLSVGGAPLASPNFTGTPAGPTAAPGTATTQLASTAFVTNAITAGTAGVSSFNTRTGAITLTPADIASAGGAPLLSPALTGTPTAPTPSAGDSSTRLATTAYVETAIGSLPSGVSTWNGRTGAVTLALSDVTSVGGAPLAAPVFTGAPAAPTPPALDNSTRLATTAFVDTAIAAIPPPAIPGPSTATPLMNGSASVGVDPGFSRGDHVHPTDTSRYAASNPSGFQTAAQVTSTLGGYVSRSGSTMIAGAVLNFNGDPNFYINGNATPGENVLSFGSGWFIGWNRTSGQLRYVGGGSTVQMMVFDGSGNLTVNGAASKPGGGAWAATSDIRVKTIEGDYAGGLAEVLRLQPILYRYKNNTDDPNADLAPRAAGDDERSHIGLVAQEAEVVMPEMVTLGPGYIDGEPVDDMRTLDTTALVFALVNAVKTLNARIAALEAAA